MLYPEEEYQGDQDRQFFEMIEIAEDNYHIENIKRMNEKKQWRKTINQKFVNPLLYIGFDNENQDCNVLCF